MRNCHTTGAAPVAPAQRSRLHEVYRGTVLPAAGSRSPGRRLLAIFGALWLVVQIFDTSFVIADSPTLTYGAAAFWIVFPLWMFSPKTVFRRGFHALLRDNALLMVLVLWFLAAAGVSAVLSVGPAESVMFVIGTGALFIICAELYHGVGADFPLLLRLFSLISAIVLLPFYLRGPLVSGARLTLSATDHPNHLGLVCFSIVAASLAWRQLYIKCGIIAVAVLALMSAESRASLVASAVAVSVLFVCSFRRGGAIFKILATIGCIAIVFIVLPDRLRDTVSQVLLLNDSYRGLDANLGRTGHLSAGLDLFLRSPVFGHGYRIEYRYLPETLLTAGAIHNAYLGLLVEVGVVGAVPLFCILLVAVARLWRGARNTPLLAVGFSFVSGYLAIALVDPFLVNLANPASCLAWCFILGAFRKTLVIRMDGKYVLRTATA